MARASAEGDKPAPKPAKRAISSSAQDPGGVRVARWHSDHYNGVEPFGLHEVNDAWPPDRKRYRKRRRCKSPLSSAGMDDLADVRLLTVIAYRSVRETCRA